MSETTDRGERASEDVEAGNGKASKPEAMAMPELAMIIGLLVLAAGSFWFFYRPLVMAMVGRMTGGE
jgi:hypothetical protein